MTDVHILAIDITKRSFQVCATAAEGAFLFKRLVSRAKLETVLREQAPCIVAMEACATSHFWGRFAQGLGHEVRLIPPIYVKPFVKRQKNDAADATAIAEAGVENPVCVLPSARCRPSKVRAPDHKPVALCHIGQRARSSLAVRINLCEQVVQKIKSTMHVAYCIGAGTRWTARRGADFGALPEKRHDRFHVRWRWRRGKGEQSHYPRSPYQARFATAPTHAQVKMPSGKTRLACALECG